MAERMSDRRSATMKTNVNVDFKTQSRAPEWLAVLCNLAFTVMYLNQSSWSFFFGIVGPLLLLWVGLRNLLYADALLQLVYITSSVVGFWNVSDGWQPTSLTGAQHLFILFGSGAFAAVLGALLKRKTNAALPYLDSLTTAFGIAGTWLMMYQVHACWLYLMAVNALSIFIFYRRRLYAATLMFVVYLVLSIDGYFTLHWFEI